MLTSIIRCIATVILSPLYLLLALALWVVVIPTAIVRLLLAAAVRRMLRG